MTSTNRVVANALRAMNGGDAWEKVYQIKGLPVRFVYRGAPYNDLKATVDGGNRDYIAVGRIVASSPLSQSEAEKLAADKWRQIRATANGACARNAAVDVPVKFEVGKVYRAPWDKNWVAKVLSRTDSSIKVAIKSARDTTWHGKDEQVTLRISPAQSVEQGAEVAKGWDWEFWADVKATRCRR